MMPARIARRACSRGLGEEIGVSPSPGILVVGFPAIPPTLTRGGQRPKLSRRPNTDSDGQERYGGE